MRRGSSGVSFIIGRGIWGREADVVGGDSGNTDVELAKSTWSKKSSKNSTERMRRRKCEVAGSHANTLNMYTKNTISPEAILKQTRCVEGNAAAGTVACQPHVYEPMVS